MSNRSRTLRRKVSRQPLRRTLLIFVEGAKTEEQYIKSWASAYRGMVSVTVSDTRGVPLTLVKAACDTARKDRRISQKRGGPMYDEYWCMFDRDDHPNMKEAVEMARDNSIGVAVSVPCLELWFLIHFEDQTASINRASALSRSKGHLSCGKSLSSAALANLIERYPMAKGRAVALDDKHRGDGTGPFPNPSSGVWRVVDSIKWSGDTG